jgi:hypothetical protein
VQAPINEVKHKCEMEYTPFLSLQCLWRLDGLRAGQPGLDCRQGQDVSRLVLQGPPRLLSSEYREEGVSGG